MRGPDKWPSPPAGSARSPGGTELGLQRIRPGLYLSENRRERKTAAFHRGGGKLARSHLDGFSFAAAAGKGFRQAHLIPADGGGTLLSCRDQPADDRRDIAACRFSVRFPVLR